MGGGRSIRRRVCRVPGDMLLLPRDLTGGGVTLEAHMACKPVLPPCPHPPP